MHAQINAETGAWLFRCSANQSIETRLYAH